MSLQEDSKISLSTSVLLWIVKETWIIFETRRFPQLIIGRTYCSAVDPCQARRYWHLSTARMTCSSSDSYSVPLSLTFTGNSPMTPWSAQLPISTRYFGYWLRSARVFRSPGFIVACQARRQILVSLTSSSRSTAPKRFRQGVFLVDGTDMTFATILTNSQVINIVAGQNIIFVTFPVEPATKGVISRNFPRRFRMPRRYPFIWAFSMRKSYFMSSWMRTSRCCLVPSEAMVLRPYYLQMVQSSTGNWPWTMHAYSSWRYQYELFIS